MPHLGVDEKVSLRAMLAAETLRTHMAVQEAREYREALIAIRDEPLGVHENEVFVGDEDSPAERLMHWADLAKQVATDALTHTSEQPSGKDA